MNKTTGVLLFLILEDDLDDRMFLKEAFNTLPGPVDVVFFDKLDELLAFLVNCKSPCKPIVMINMFSEFEKPGENIRLFQLEFPSNPFIAMITSETEKSFCRLNDETVGRYIQIPVSASELSLLIKTTEC